MAIKLTCFDDMATALRESLEVYLAGRCDLATYLRHAELFGISIEAAETDPVWLAAAQAKLEQLQAAG